MTNLILEVLNMLYDLHYELGVRDRKLGGEEGHHATPSTEAYATGKSSQKPV